MFAKLPRSSDFNFSSSNGATSALQTSATTFTTTLASTDFTDPLQHDHWMQASALNDSTADVTAATFDRRPASFSEFTSNNALTLAADAAGDTLSTALNLGVISGSGTVRDFVGSSDPNDFYRFQITASSNLSLRLIGLAADADLYFIQDANSNGMVDRGEVLSYAIAPGSNPEAIDLTGLAAGNYFIQVTQYQGDTNYQLAITTTPSGAGGTLSTAANFGILTGQRSTNDFVTNANPQAFYRFQLNAISNLNLTLNGLSADADLYLIRDNNNNGAIDSNDVLAASVAPGTTPDSINVTGLAAGTYFVDVIRYSGNTTYNLTLTADAAGNTLNTARNIGSLYNTQRFNDFVGSADSADFYRFSLSNTSNFSLNLSGLSADADAYLIRDANGNGAIDLGEILAASITAGSSSETIVLNNLAAGSYIVLVNQFNGNTNYSLQLAATPVGGLQIVQGTLSADTFTYNANYRYSVFSGNGNLAFGSGRRDLLDLSTVLSSSVSFNLIGINGNGVLFDSGNGTQMFDGLLLSNGNQILFEGIDSIRFADRTFNLAIIPNDPLFSQQWSLTMMGVQSAWRLTTGSNNVLIGIEDSGLGFNSAGIHPDLRIPIVIDGNLADEFAEPTSHGTAVEGILSAISNNGIGLSGINWSSPVAQVDVISGREAGDRNLTQATQALIAQAARNGQRLVINLSLTATTIEPAFEQLIASHQTDVLFVIASGNDGSSSLAYPAYLANFYSNVIAVGASFGTVDSSGNAVVPGTRAPYSNYGYGLTLMGPTNVVATRAVASPSGVVFGYDPQFTGTSAAAPNVTGVASLVWSANPNLTATQVQQILSETAYDLGAPGYDFAYGNGFVNADTAVRRAIALGAGAV
ncbi:MAG: S8 family serine peptidase [Tildeniella nuda ZEHNDER 1965/U140]|jgi:subtilisin family serine protease|nr:S8 family serine peptidase [Tildeniella nuda ZEHNDER 1965/U140]